jgi:hypothetical protein
MGVPVRVLPVVFSRPAKHLAPRPRRTALLAAGALFLPVLLVALPAGPADATIPGSTFNAGDGNLVVDSGDVKDWANVTPFFSGTDLPTGKNDDAFAGGIDEDTVNPTLTKGAIPNSKDDLARFYLSFEKNSSDQELLYLAWIRSKTSGSADMDFELNQATTTTADGLPTRTPGDLLVTYEFTSTKTPDIRIQRWSTTPGAACVTASAPPCWANRVLVTSPNAEAKVNDGNVVTDPRANNARLASQTFGEAALNLTGLQVFTSGTCTRFARAFAKSRSSQSFNSSMQDLIAPININFSNCATKTFNVTMSAGVPTGLTPYAVYTIGGTTTATPLTQSGTTTTWTGTDAAITPGSTLTALHLELRTATGAVAWRSANSADETINGNATNTGAFSYRVTLTPASAENFVGRAHVLTATVLGKGSLNGVPANPAETPIVGVPVRFQTFNGTPAGCGSLSPTSATTDASGQAQSTLTSTTACSTSIRAWVDNVGGTAGAFDSTKDTSGSATKTFVSYGLSVSPASATNALGTNHTFTITLTRNTGSGPVGYAGQTVTFSLSNAAATGAHLVSVNGAPASGTSGSCTTQADGTCTVIATATHTGTFTLDASYAASNDSGQGTFTGSGSKSYVDYRVDVTPPTATNEVGVPHTFTVTLTRDTGSGYLPYAGQQLSLSLDPGTSDAHLTAINGTSASGTTGSCTTQANGTCSVTIVATTPGLARLTATFGTTLASGPFTTSDTGDKQYSAFSLSASPIEAVNDLGQPHTFTVRLTRDDGTGATGLAGETVNLSLSIGTTDGHFTSINGSPASGTTGSCVTRADGTCAVTIVSSLPGTIVLTATWDKALTDSTAHLTASATKHYLSVSVSKTSCAAGAPVGGLLRFDIPYSVQGADLTHAVITDNLPAGLAFFSASPAPTTAPAVGSTGTVTWNLGTVPDGTSSAVSLVVSVLQLGTQVNTGTLTADGGISKAFSSTVTGSSAGETASGRAYGLTAALGGTTVLDPKPDTATKNPDSLLSLGLPLALAPVASGGVGLLNVANTPTLLPTSAEDEAVASVADVNLTVAGVPITAKVVAARSDSLATGATAWSSMDGSQVVGLKVGTGVAQDYSSPTVVPVVNLLGVKVAEISVLEQVDRSGAALGGAAGAQPQSGLFSSGLGVNGLHIRLLDSNVEVVVSHADSRAAYPDATPCSTTGPYLIGSAFVANEVLDYPTGPTTVSVVPVTLGSAGGSQSGATNAADLALIGATAGTGTASTEGVLSTPRVDSDAAVQRLNIKNGTTSVLSATLIQSHASVNGLSPTGTTIAKLVLGGQDLCVLLGLTSTCTPPPNTKLLDLSKTLTIVLNEQLTSNGVTTVNAVHVYVLGAGNPLGLPIGSDLVISSSTAGTGS